MDISNIRQRFPEYGDMSDEDLLRGLHGKFYSDMPFEQFAERVGVHDNVEPSWGDVAEGAIMNLPESVYGQAKDLVKAALNPIDTLKGVYSVAKGMARTLSPVWEADEDDMSAFTSLADMYKGRYGSLSNFKLAFMNDPAAILGDAAALLSAGAGAAAKAPTMGRVAKMAKAAANVVDPMNTVRQAAALPLRAIGSTQLPQRMYMSAAKPSTTLDVAERARAFKAAIEHKIMPVKQDFIEKGKSSIGLEGGLFHGRGYEAVDGQLNQASNKLKTALEAADMSDKVVPKDGIVDDVYDYTIERMKYEPDPSKSIKQTSQVLEDLIESHPDEMKPSYAHKVKQAAQKKGSRAFGEEYSTPQKTTYKAISHSINERLYEQFPELRQLNQNTQELINLKEAIHGAIPRTENHNMLGLGSSVALGAGAAGGLPAIPLGTALVAKQVLGLPKVKSRLAIALARARHMPNISTPGTFSRGLVADQRRSMEE